MNRYAIVNLLVCVGMLALCTWGLRAASPGLPWYGWMIASPVLLVACYLLVHRVTSAFTNPVVAKLTHDPVWEGEPPKGLLEGHEATSQDTAYTESQGPLVFAGGNH